MFLEFKTSNKNTYGHRKYLIIDTVNSRYSTNCNSMVITGVEIKTKDYKAMIDELKNAGFMEVDNI